ncbi:hypothetical protein V6N11_032810 [Hibiscus sabdariffa]|uniref:Mediator of RNA polymerase II transcription subunit 11 n=1 Tax=Hibiscus sabdariffa TaxID=183260 RepID=A0ABR2T2J9_9ROSI
MDSPTQNTSLQRLQNVEKRTVRVLELAGGVMDELANPTGPRKEFINNHCLEFMKMIKDIQVTLRDEIKSACEYCVTTHPSGAPYLGWSHMDCSPVRLQPPRPHPQRLFRQGRIELQSMCDHPKYGAPEGWVVTYCPFKLEKGRRPALGTPVAVEGEMGENLTGFPVSASRISIVFSATEKEH